MSPATSATTDLAALLQVVTWPDVKAALVWSYAGTEDGLDEYHRVFLQLASTPAEPSSMRIAISIRSDQGGHGGKPLFDVSGCNGTLYRQLTDTGVDWSNSPRADQEVNHGLAFTPREEWVGMVIDRQTLSTFSPAQVIAHCLWEMTFYGFDEQDVNRLKSTVVTALADLESMTPQQRRAFSRLKD